MTETWTVEDAAALLDPPMTATQIRALIKTAAIPSVGQRRTGKRGRPAPTYDSTTLLQAHAALAPFLAAAEHRGMSAGESQ